MSNGSERTPERTVDASPLEVPAATSSETGSDLKSVEGDPWVGFTGESQADREAAELTDPLLKVIAEQRSRIAALEAVIREALTFDGQQTVDGVTDRGYLSPEEWREEKIALILDTAPSVVLDQVIREAKAEAVEAARDAIMPPVNWNLRPDGTEMPGTQHIDGALHDIHVQLTQMAADIRSDASEGDPR